MVHHVMARALVPFIVPGHAGATIHFRIAILVGPAGDPAAEPWRQAVRR